MEQWACVSCLHQSALLALGYWCVPLCDLVFISALPTPKHTHTHTHIPPSVLLRSIWVPWSKENEARGPWRTSLITTAWGKPCHLHQPYPTTIIIITAIIQHRNQYASTRPCESCRHPRLDTCDIYAQYTGWDESYKGMCSTVYHSGLSQVDKCVFSRCCSLLFAYILQVKCLFTRPLTLNKPNMRGNVLPYCMCLMDDPRVNAGSKIEYWEQLLAMLHLQATFILWNSFL